MFIPVISHLIFVHNSWLQVTETVDEGTDCICKLHRGEKESIGRDKGKREGHSRLRELCKGPKKMKMLGLLGDAQSVEGLRERDSNKASTKEAGFAAWIFSSSSETILRQLFVELSENE